MKQAKRYNAGKPEMHYLDQWFDALAEVCLVCMQGAQKYERGNYLQGQPYSELLSAAQRHLMKFGQHNRPDIDDESGRHHIGHAIWNLLQLLQHEVGPGVGKDWDDRIRPPDLDPLGDMIADESNLPASLVGLIHTDPPDLRTFADPAERVWYDDEMEQRDADLRAQADPSHGYPAHVVEPWIGGQDS